MTALSSRTHQLTACLLLLLLALALVLSHQRAAYAATVDVEVGDNYFDPDRITIEVGDTVRWTYFGGSTHNVYAVDGSWDSPDFTPGLPQTRTFNEPGEWRYLCKYHAGSQKGTILIVDPAAQPEPTEQPPSEPNTAPPPATQPVPSPTARHRRPAKRPNPHRSRPPPPTPSRPPRPTRLRLPRTRRTSRRRRRPRPRLPGPRTAKTREPTRTSHRPATSSSGPPVAGTTAGPAGSGCSRRCSPARAGRRCSASVDADLMEARVDGRLARVLIGVAAAILLGTALVQLLDRAGSEAENLVTPDMAGWRHTGGGSFVVEQVDGETVYRTEGGMGLLWLDRVLIDFTLRLEVQVPPERANSGVFIRIPEPPVDDSYVSRAFEVQIDTGGEDAAATGAVYGIQPPFVPVELEPGAWHTVTIRAAGPQIDVMIDGVTVNTFQARRDGPVTDFAASGYIGLQNHSDADTVRFRRIELVERRRAHGRDG